MSGVFFRRGVSVLAMLCSLVIASLASVGSVAASPQMGSGNGARFAYSGTLECPSPPANWDPTTATADQLRFYGLPLPHASSGSVYLQWLNKMRHITRRICGGEVVGKSYSHLPQNHTSSDTVGSNGEIWSGYVVDDSGFNFASADWYVPCYYGTNNSQRAIEWVGIGGISANNLWQAGTESDHAEGYRFWYEDFPTGPTMIYAGPSVTCNQSVFVLVDYNWDVPGKSFVYMLNNTNGQYWSTTKSFVPDNHSAEWIVERPGCGTITNPKNYALAPIDPVYISSAYAASTSYDNDNVHNLTYFDNYEESMYQNNVLLSDNSAVSGGTFFVSYYHNSGVSYC